MNDLLENLDLILVSSFFFWISFRLECLDSEKPYRIWLPSINKDNFQILGLTATFKFN